jgi:hypothetical protein
MGARFFQFVAAPLGLTAVLAMFALGLVQSFFGSPDAFLTSFIR